MVWEENVTIMKSFGRTRILHWVFSRLMRRVSARMELVGSCDAMVGWRRWRTLRRWRLLVFLVVSREGILGDMARWQPPSIPSTLSPLSRDNVDHYSTMRTSLALLYVVSEFPLGFCDAVCDFYIPVDYYTTDGVLWTDVLLPTESLSVNTLKSSHLCRTNFSWHVCNWRICKLEDLMNDVESRDVYFVEVGQQLLIIIIIIIIKCQDDILDLLDPTRFRVLLSTCRYHMSYWQFLSSLWNILLFTNNSG